ncbi:MAG: dephospho-CoA kinase [Deltaproteobacteria bacterium GWC2_42_11]|nr:MAG: dephospho-CoA kinase [Deltaproteobacteria bacterium GWC2_42_11]HBO85274.1 dephospho-CoA kinase [Deltaproteobacteria bacterium]
MLIGLTGGIASGKSLVAKYLKELGAHIIDADEISRRITVPGMPAYNDIVTEFGMGILNPDRTINRKKLGNIVFKNRELLKRLNQITHPGIIEEENRAIRDIFSRDPDAIIVVNAALLIESGHYKEMDRVIVVYVDEETQIKRLMERDGLSEDESMERILSQMPLKEKIKFANFVADNTNDADKTKQEVMNIFKKLRLGYDKK